MKRITVAVCLALLPFAADAAGLGKLTVVSGLGQPLNAEIELLSTTKDELSSMSARIAPSNAYAEQGIERASILSAVRVELSNRPDGIPILKITSPQPINDPFLDMLIEVDWSSGRLLREYTALLDPPGFGDQPATSVAAPIAQEQPVAAEEKLISKPMAGAKASAEKKGKSRKAAASKAAPAIEQAQEAATSEGHLTQRGDTLRAIASQMPAVEGISLDQMLVGVYRANPEAFDGNNMNRLKVGQIVRQPSAEELQTVSPQEAAKEIRIQTADWNTYRNKLASAVAESTAPKEEAPRQTASGKITAAAEDKGTAPSTGPRDVVRLSKAETAPEKTGAAAETKGAAAAKGGAPDKAGALQEEAIAREKAVKEANDRVAMLEKEVQELKRLLEMKNQAMVDLQKNAAAQKAEPAKPAAPPPPAKVAPVTPPAAPEIKPEAKPEIAEKPKHKPKKIVVPPPAEPDLVGTVLSQIMGNLPLLGGLLAALGGVGWLAARRKGKKKEAAEEQALPATGAAPVAAAGDTSFLTDFSHPAGGGMIDTSEVDPISEAEVYMAYGRDAQAEEILKEAIKKDPTRYELHVKLLEIYANRNDKAAFEPLADQLYTTPGTADPIWPKVAELGRKVDPDNPRYAGQPAEGLVAESVADMEETQILAAAEAAPAEAETPPPADTSLDFSLDAGTGAKEPPAAEAAEDNSLDFDIGALGGAEDVALEIPAIESQDETPAVADLNVTEAETAGLDFSLELPEPAAEENVQLNEADLGIAVLPEITFPEAEPLAISTEESSPSGAGIESMEEKSMEEFNLEPAAEATPILPEAEEAGIETLPELEEPATANATDEVVLELPEMASDEAAAEINLEELSAEPGESPSDFDLELPEFEIPAAEESVAEESAMEAQPEEEEMAFELPPAEEFAAVEIPAEIEPALEAPVAEEPVAEAAEEEVAEEVAEEISLEAPPALPEAEEPALDFEQTMIMQMPSAQEEAIAAPAAAEESIVLEEVTPEAGAIDLDLEAEQGGDKPLPEVDLSGIDLELGADKPAVEPGLEPLDEEEITLSTGPEPPDVDTKLDLVTAYLDMGDKEGARELLQEILDEGGEHQRERAQKMMDAID